MIDSGCGESEPYALRVLGDSMEPEFSEGSIVVIDPAAVIRDGSYVIAEHDGELIFRRLSLTEGQCQLTALNTDYASMEVSGLEVVRGVVIQKAGRRRKDRKFYT